MARDKAKYQLLPALCPEGKDAVTSVQILLHHLIWKPSAEAVGARISHNMGNQIYNSSFLPCSATIMLLSHASQNLERPL